MIIDDKIQKILQTNDFQRMSRSELLEKSQKTSSVVLSSNSKPSRRKVIKLKNSLLQSHVSPDVQRMYYQTQKIEQPSLHQKSEAELKAVSQVQLPPLQKKETPALSDTNSKINPADLVNAIQEIFPPDHQLWSDLQIQGQSIEEVIVQNQDYFTDLLSKSNNKLALYLQEMEIRVLKDKKQHCKSKYNTQYHDDFSDKLVFENTSINRWIYERAKQSASFLQNASTYNQHFQPQRYEKVDNFKPDHIPNLNQISCLSSYHANFRDWKKLYHGIIGPFHLRSDKQLPFIGETNYTRNYVTQKYSKTDLIVPKPLGPFPVDTQSLVRETTHKSQFPQPRIIDQNIPQVISPRIMNYNGYQPHFAKQTTHQETNFAERFFHSPVIRELMKKNQHQQIN